jgi:hypothetical protein
VALVGRLQASVLFGTGLVKGTGKARPLAAVEPCLWWRLIPLLPTPENIYHRRSARGSRPTGRPAARHSTPSVGILGDDRGRGRHDHLGAESSGCRPRSPPW